MSNHGARLRLHEAVDRLPNDMVAPAIALLERLGTAADDAHHPQPSDAPPDSALLDRIPHIRVEMGMVFGWPWQKDVAYLWPRRPRP